MAHAAVPIPGGSKKQHDKQLQQLIKKELKDANEARKGTSQGTTIKNGGVVACPKPKAAIEVDIVSTNPTARSIGAANVTFGANGGALTRTGVVNAYLPLPGPTTVTITVTLVSPDVKYFISNATYPVSVTVPPGLTKAVFKYTPLVRPVVQLNYETGAAAVPGVGIMVGTIDLGDTQVNGRAQLQDDHPGIAPAVYPVTFTFKGTQPKRFTVIDDRNIDTGAGGIYSLHKFTVRKLAWPKIKVVVDGSLPERVVQGVGVKLGTTDLGLTNGKGIAAQEEAEAGVIEGTYPVALILKGRGLERYVPVTDNLTVDVARGSEDTYTVKVKAASLLVIVRRADGTPAKGPIAFDLAGSTNLADQPLAACSDPDDNRVEKKVKDALAPGAYTVTIKNLPAVLDAQKSAPLSPERWRIGPDKTGKVKVNIVAGNTATVEFTLTRYRKIQFVAFNILPSTEVVSSVEKYLGDPDQQTDLDKRCQIMQAAMTAATAHTAIDTNDYVLKVFMAPEFYFRGADGGYELKYIHDILDKMRPEAAKYDDWLFVYGTAIGYQKHQSDPTSVSKIDAPTGFELKITTSSAALVTTIRVTDDKDKAKVCDRIPSNANPLVRWTVTQGALTAKVVKVTKISATEYDLELDGVVALLSAPCKLLEPIAYQLTISSSTAAAVTTIRLTDGADKVKVCDRIPAGSDPLLRWTVAQGGVTAKVVSVTKISDTQYDLALDSLVVLANTGCALLEAEATEVFNVALVQKGGSGAGSTGLREAAIYKEYVSHIDFIIPSGTTYDDFHDPTGRGRKIDIHGDTTRTVLPTAGSVDKLGGQPNRNDSEVNRSGIGGGGVFMVDGVTFGLEICRDHCLSKLGDYYKSRSAGGDPKVQIVLIPSWGAQIEDGAIAAVKNGLVFNVDGPKGSAAALLSEPLGKCPNHAGLFPAPGECTHIDFYYCDRKPHPVTANPCPNCTKPARPHYDYHFCTNEHLQAPLAVSCARCTAPVKTSYKCARRHYVSAPGVCAKCGTTLRAAPPSFYCPAASHTFTTAGTCVCGQPLAPYNTSFRCVRRHSFAAGGDCPQCSQTLVAAPPVYFCPRTAHFKSTVGNCSCGGPTTPIKYCDQRHQFPVTDSVCPDCSKPLAKHVGQWYCDEPFHTAPVAGTGNCPLCNQPWLEYHNPLEQQYARFGAIDGDPLPNTKGSAPILFAQDGNLKIYPVKDIPEAESIP